MAFGYFDRVKETTATTGTGALTLGGAVAGFRTFSSVLTNLDTAHYSIVDTAGNWEVGLGTWVTGNQLQRTSVLASSNAGALVNFPAGSKDVFITFPASFPQRQTNVKRVTFGDSEYNNGDSGAAKTITAANGDAQKLRVTADCVLSFILDAVGWFQVRYYNDLVGGHTLTHPGGINWQGGIAPVIATGADVSTIVDYFYDGTVLYGSAGTPASGAGDIKSDGTVAMAADLNMGGNQVANAGDAGAATDLTTLQQVQALIAAAVSTVADWKQSVRFATTAALAASTRVGNVRTANANGAFPSVDGVAVVVNDRFLDKDHATGADRGYWQITNLGSGGTPWVITRTADADTSVEVTTGSACLVEEGTANKGHVFLLTTANPITINVTALVFTDLQTLAADEVTLTLSGGVLSVKTNGVGNGQLRQSATCSFIGRGPNSLGNVGDIAVGTNGFVALRRANVLTAALIIDENVDPAAAVAGTKIAPQFGAQSVTATATGGHSFGATAASATLLETFDISGRTLVALLFGAQPTSTELPANGGNRVIQLGASLSFPTAIPGGNALFTLATHDTHGLGAFAKNGIERTIVPMGDSTSATRKLDHVEAPSKVTPGVVATTEISAIEIDAVGFNGAALPAGTYRVTFEGEMQQTAGGGLRHCWHDVALIKYTGGTLTILGAHWGFGIKGDSTPPTVAAIDVTGTLIRGRIAPGSSTALTIFARMHIHGFAP